jgi:phage shock protein B
MVLFDLSVTEAVTVLGLIFLLFVAPIWIAGHYMTRWRAIRGLAAQDEKLLSDLWDAARRFEERLDNLDQAIGPLDQAIGAAEMRPRARPQARQ